MNLAIYLSEFRYNFKLAYPIIIAMLGHTLVGFIDNVMVGNIGATELAAASLANSFVFIALAAGIGFSTAITPLIAQSDTENNLSEGRSYFINGLYLCTFIGLLLFGILYSAKGIINYMNQPAEVMEKAKPFLDVVAFSLVPAIAFQGFKQFADGKSFTKYSMYATIISNIVNIVLNYVLIYGIWIFPKIGMMGVAYGTLISRFCMLIYIYFALRKNPLLQSFVKKIKLSEFSWNISREIWSKGIPSGLQSFFEVALFTGAVWLSGMLGTASQAANQIALSLASMTFMFISGLSVAAMIRTGNQIGLKDYKKMKIIAHSIMLMTIIMCSFFALLFFVFNSFIPHLFLNSNDVENTILNKEVVQISANLLIIAGIFQISDGLQVVILGVLRGLRDATIPMIITFVSYWIVGYPLCIYLGLYTNLGVEGIWIGLLLGLTVAAILLYIRFKHKTTQLIENNTL